MDQGKYDLKTSSILLWIIKAYETISTVAGVCTFRRILNNKVIGFTADLKVKFIFNTYDFRSTGSRIDYEEIVCDLVINIGSGFYAKNPFDLIVKYKAFCFRSGFKIKNHSFLTVGGIHFYQHCRLRIRITRNIPYAIKFSFIR